MAHRVVLIAARNCTTREFRDAFSVADTRTVYEVSGYVWFLTSAWTLRYSTIQKGVRSLPGPILFMNSLDGSCWNLWLARDGKEGFRYHHPFADLPALQDKTRLDEADWLVAHGHIDVKGIIEGWEIYGDPLPSVVTDQMLSMNSSEALVYLFTWKGEQLLEALKKFDIPHEPSEILAIIHGQSVTEAELETDVGSLPRFLVSLGFGEYFNEWLENQQREYEEEFGQEDERYEELPRFDFGRARSNDLIPIVDGPVDVPFTLLRAPIRIAHLCDGDISAGVDIHLPAQTDPDNPFKREHWFRYDQTDNHVQFSVPKGGLLLIAQGDMLYKQISTLPEGSKLEIVTWGDVTEAGRHRYSGTVTNGEWRLEKTFPPVVDDTLRSVFSLFDLIMSEEPISAEDEDELNAVLKRSQTDSSFGDPPLSSDGLHFICNEWQREEVIKHLFRYRFGHVWNVGYAVELERKDYEEFQKILNDAVSWIPKIQPTDVLIYKGEREDFYEVDTSQLSDELLSNMEQAGREIEAEGFTFVANMTAPKTFGEILIHGYVHPTEDIYASYFIGTLGQSSFDCYTRFEDGSSLTTTTLQGEVSIENQGIYYNCPQVSNFKELLNEHLAAIEERRKEGLSPIPAERSLRGLPKEIDMFLKRRLA